MFGPRDLVFDVWEDGGGERFVVLDTIAGDNDHLGWHNVWGIPAPLQGTRAMGCHWPIPQGVTNRQAMDWMTQAGFVHRALQF